MCSIPVSFLIVSFATGTSLFEVDAWNTWWNDEVGYFHVVEMMRSYGLDHTMGMYGYDEKTLSGVSYGPYALTTYYLYVAMTFFMDPAGHNSIYCANIVLSVASVVVIILLLKPSVRQSLVLAAFFALNFILARYAISGMVEEMYVFVVVLTTAIMLRLFDGDEARQPPSAGVTVASYCIVIVGICFIGTMRPFFLAFLVIPLYLLFSSKRLSQTLRVILVLILVLAVAIALKYHFDFRLVTRSPYFGETSASGLLSDGVPNIVTTNIEWVYRAGKALLAGQWRGATLFALFACFVFLACYAVLRRRRGDARSSNLALCFLLFGLATYEANVILYVFEQAHRMFLPLVVSFMIFAALRGTGRGGGALCAACVIPCMLALVVGVNSFALPQKDSSSISAEDFRRVRAELTFAMPLSDNPWDNTCAKVVESRNVDIFFCFPAHISSNVCSVEYIEQSLQNNTLKSKYLCLPIDEPLNDYAEEKGKVLFVDEGHVIYQMR